jgi:hypothetical protein
MSVGGPLEGLYIWWYGHVSYWSSYGMHDISHGSSFVSKIVVVFGLQGVGSKDCRAVRKVQLWNSSH